MHDFHVNIFLIYYIGGIVLKKIVMLGILLLMLNPVRFIASASIVNENNDCLLQNSSMSETDLDSWMPDKNLQNYIVDYLGLNSINQITRKSLIFTSNKRLFYRLF